METTNIRLGTTYKKMYLNTLNKDFIQIPAKQGFVQSYLVSNKSNQPRFRGILNILADGRAVINVDYISFSGVHNKYKNYFDIEGREIIHDLNNTSIEEHYFDKLT